MKASVLDLSSPSPAGGHSPRQVTKVGEDEQEWPGGCIELGWVSGGARTSEGGWHSTISVCSGGTSIRGHATEEGVDLSEISDEIIGHSKVVHKLGDTSTKGEVLGIHGHWI